VPDWDYDGTRILGHIGYDVYVWDARTGRQLYKLVGHRERIDSLQFSPDGAYALSSSWLGCGEVCSYHLPQFQSKDTSTRLWDLRSGKEIWRLEGQIAGKFSPDGKRLLTFSMPEDQVGKAGLAMWDVASGRKLFAFMPDQWQETVAFSPDGRTFFCLGRPAHIYDSETGREIGQIPRVDSFNFYGRDGSLAVSVSNVLQIWDSTGHLTRQIPFVHERFGGFYPAWSQDGTRVVGDAVVQDAHWNTPPACRIRVWNVDSGDSVAVPNCPLGAGAQMISPDGKRFLLLWNGYWESGKFVKQPLKMGMWDLDSGKELWEIPSSPGLLGFSPDGNTVLVLEGLQRATGGQPDLHFSVYSSDSGRQIVTLDLQGKLN
jgi:WD40 repeat protein